MKISAIFPMLTRIKRINFKILLRNKIIINNFFVWSQNYIYIFNLFLIIMLRIEKREKFENTLISIINIKNLILNIFQKYYKFKILLSVTNIHA